MATTSDSSSAVDERWPNKEGFDPHYEEHSPVELQIKGVIPSYAYGVLYRTGPGGYTLQTDQGNTFVTDHWFDGFAQVHKFQLIPEDTPGSGAKVLYSSRIIAEALVKQIKKTGRTKDFTFGQKPDPTQSYLNRLTTMLKPAESEKSPEHPPVNIAVTMSVNLPGLASKQTKPGPSESERRYAIKTLHTKTDSSQMQQVDPDTLEPIGVARQTEFHPLLKGPMAASHARTDPATGDFYNFNLEIGAVGSTYRVFCVSASTGETTILATIPAPAAYIHSFFLSSEHVILCIWNSHLKAGGLVVPWNRNIADSIAPFDPSIPSQWYVVDRVHGRGLLATYEGPAFFAFHTVNAWSVASASDPSSIDILADIVTHDGLDIVPHLYYREMTSEIPSPEGTRASYRRFRLLAVPHSPTKAIRKAIVEFTALEDCGPELPTLNSTYITRPHRYSYAVCDRGRSSLFDGLVKFDSVTQERIVWERHGHTPGEAIFVPDPDGAREDDGVLLSVVLDGFAGRSYLLCLDAREMRERGRAEVPGAVAFGFHGTHVPERGRYLGDS